MEVPESESPYHLAVVKFGNINRYLLPNDKVEVIVKAKYRVTVNNVSGV